MNASHASIIDGIGVNRLAEAAGVDPSHVRTMKARGSIPPAYWQSVVAAAEEAGIPGVTFEALARLAAERAERRAVRPPTEAA